MKVTNSYNAYGMMKSQQKRDDFIVPVDLIKREVKKMSDNQNPITPRKCPPILKFLASVGGRIVLTIGFTIIIFGLVFLAMKIHEAVALVLAVAFGFFGWQALNRITPEMFVWMPVGSWLIYYLVKGFISIFIGTFIAPVWLGKKISFKVMEYVDAMMQ